MKRLPALAALLLALAPAAQEPAARRSLADLNRAFMEQRMQMLRTEGMSMQQHRELLGKFAAELESFLAKEAQGTERFEGHLMLTDVYRSLEDSERAQKTLRAFEVDAAPALLAVDAARLAGEIGLDEQRKRWIDAALKKTMPLAERMQVAAHLMTILQEIELGERVFAEALAAAKDDEARAEVVWFQARATREREDLPEGAYDEALEALAAKYPQTRWGRIAADRTAARGFKVGAQALPLDITDLDGKPIALADWAGKVLLIEFWASWCGTCMAVAPTLKTMHAKYRERGFDMLGISLDHDRAALDKNLAEHRYPWRVSCDGLGWESPIALRHAVEEIPHLLLIGRDGRIAAMNLFPSNDIGKQVLAEEIEKALAEPAPDKK
jgi:thiol-disulfide isomerase/thioredoxin